VFDIHQDLYTRAGELDDREVGKYIDGLIDEFAAAPEAKPLLDSGEGIGWAGSMMEYSLNHLGVSPDRMSVPDFNEVVFDLFPRKFSVKPEAAPAIVRELRAFWQFLGRQYGLANADKILASLDDAATERLRQELADPSNYGMAKSFVMLGQQAGFDMTTQEGIDQFMLVYNNRLMAGQLPAGALADEGRDWPLSLPPVNPLSPKQRAEKRKAHKRQRQARQRNRKR
jgi:hypothetical protein